MALKFNVSNHVIYYWIEQTVKNICSEIKIFFEKNDLLFTDSNCGTQKKKKSKK